MSPRVNVVVEIPQLKKRKQEEETGIPLIQSERAPSCPPAYIGRQDGCRSGVMQICPRTPGAVTFSSAAPRLLLPHPVASHQRRPPCAPCSPQPGCSHGNSRIRSGPVSAVSVSSLSLLGLFFFCSVRPSQRGFWLLPILALRSMFGFFFFLPPSCFILHRREEGGKEGRCLCIRVTVVVVVVVVAVE